MTGTHEKRSALCPRCGYDLRSQVETMRRQKSDTVVCTECGINLDKRDLEFAQNSWLFEQNWRLKPFDRMWSTILRACKPTTFWREIRINDQTRLLPPFLLLLGIIAFFVIGLLAIAVYENTSYSRTWPGSNSFDYWVDQVIRASRELLRDFGSRYLIPFFMLLAIPSSILVFPLIRHRVKIRREHLLRVCLYASFLPIIVVGLWALIASLLQWLFDVDSGALINVWEWFDYKRDWPIKLMNVVAGDLPTYALLLFLVCWMGLHWRCACAGYLRLPRTSRSVDRAIIASAVIVLLLLAFTEFWLRFPGLFVD